MPGPQLEEIFWAKEQTEERQQRLFIPSSMFEKDMARRYHRGHIDAKGRLLQGQPSKIISSLLVVSPSSLKTFRILPANSGSLTRNTYCSSGFQIPLDITKQPYRFSKGIFQ